MILRLPCFVLSAVFLSAFSGAFTGCEGKPHPQDSKSSENVSPSDSISPLLTSPDVSYPAGTRRLIASRTNDGFWSASSRLPTSSESGGNEHSRYKIRRDGSLSLALKTSPSTTTTNTFQLANFHKNNNLHNTPHKESPTELRSFSVVLSDVDVVGRYGKPQSTGNQNKSDYEDSYSEAGVSSYHLHSNSIHRMNASWKLNPSNSSPTSEELLQFLSLFSANEEEPSTHSTSTQSHPNHHPTNQHYSFRPHNSDDDPSQSPSIPLHNMRKDVKKEHGSSLKDVNLMPFRVWSESSRSLENDKVNVSAVINRELRPNGRRNANMESNGTSRVVLHDLILTLGKLNENSENGTINLNLNGLDMGNKSQEDESRMKPTDPQQTASDLKKLMGLLIQAQGGSSSSSSSSSSNAENDSGANVVNVVIAPEPEPSTSTNTITRSQLFGHRIGQEGGSSVNTQDSSLTPQQKQKILFLKTPQVKQLLDSALFDPAVSSAAQKIAAALYVPPSKVPSGLSNHKSPSSKIAHHPHLHSYLSPPSSNISTSNDNFKNSTVDKLTTPDGFPLTASGFLSLHHPNLQFHQALHHLIANGTAPTSINATTKTNVINIFVLNFNGEHPNNNTQTAFESTKHKELLKEREQDQIQQRNPFPQRFTAPSSTTIISQQQQSRFPLKSSFAHIKPILIEKVEQSPMILFDKIGQPSPASTPSTVHSWLAEQSPVDETTSKYQSVDLTPLPSTVNNTAVPAEPSPVHSDRVNILDLLPGDLSFTKVDFSDYVQADDHDESQDTIIDLPNMPPQGNFTYLGYSSTEPTHEGTAGLEGPNPGNEDLIAFISQMKDRNSSYGPSLPSELSHLSWIFNNEPPPKPFIENSNKKDFDFLPDYDDPDFPEESITFANKLLESSTIPSTKLTSTSQATPTSEPTKFTQSTSSTSTTQEMRLNQSTPTATTQYTRLNQTTPTTQYTRLNQTTPTTQHTIPLQTTDSNLDIFDDEIEDFSTTTDPTPETSPSDISTSLPHLNTTKKTPFVALRNNQSDPFESTTPGPVRVVGIPVPSRIAIPNRPVAVAVQGGGVLTPNTDRIRRLMIALGYSAIPTLAAGAAATWSYWIPLVATAASGRRRRSLHKNITEEHFVIPTDAKIETGFTEIGESEQQPLNAKEVIVREPLSRSGSNSSGLLFSKNAPDRIEGEKETKINSNFSQPPSPDHQPLSKWIKVEVITESSPTYTSTTQSSAEALRNHSVIAFKGNNNNGPIKVTGTVTNEAHECSHSSQSNHNTTVTNNNTRAINANNTTDINNNNITAVPSSNNDRHLPQDVPLLKNFLKNVLSNEWNISTSTTPSPLLTHLLPVPLATFQDTIPPAPKPIPQWLSSSSNYFNLKNQTQASITQGMTNFSTFKPPGQSVSIIIGHHKIHEIRPNVGSEGENKHDEIPGPNNDDNNEASIRKKKLLSIVEAEESYTSAALLPIWFPIIFGNRKLAHENPSLNSSIID